MIIADWWHFVYSDIMGESFFLMMMFGWELFLMPIVLVLSVLSAVAHAVFRVE